MVHVGGASSKGSEGAKWLPHVQGMLRLQRKRLTPMQFAILAPCLKAGLFVRRLCDLLLAPVRYASRRLRGQRARAARGMALAT